MSSSLQVEVALGAKGAETELRPLEAAVVGLGASPGALSGQAAHIRALGRRKWRVSARIMP